MDCACASCARRTQAAGRGDSGGGAPRRLRRRSVRNLSGGQQQRVALARAIAIEPDILLMDEPLGALDKQLRKEVQIEIRRMHVARPRTTLYVTHDQEEALVMSDRIAVMREGALVQTGAAQELYSRPVDSFVARFLGESNLIAGRVAELRKTDARRARRGPRRADRGPPNAGLTRGQAACALIRPEHIRPSSPGRAGAHRRAHLPRRNRRAAGSRCRAASNYGRVCSVRTRRLATRSKSVGITSASRSCRRQHDGGRQC